MRRSFTRTAFVLTFALLLTVALTAAIGPWAGAATCGEKTLNVNLAQGCVTIANTPILSPAADTTACADAAGCADVKSPSAAAPVVQTRPLAPAPARHTPPAKPRLAPAPAMPHFTYRVNRFDAAPGESFYGGDFRVLLPYSSQPPAVSPLPPSGAAFGGSWHIPQIPREVFIVIFGVLMLAVSAGGARRIRATY